MHVFVCVNCGTMHSSNAKKDWGRTAPSNGCGPRASCVKLVPNEYAPKAPDGSVPLQLCGGDLVAEEHDAAAVKNAEKVGAFITHA